MDLSGLKIYCKIASLQFISPGTGGSFSTQCEGLINGSRTNHFSLEIEGGKSTT